MARSESLFEAALKRIRVIRQGDIVQLVIDGGGAMVTTTQEFMQAQKWASSKTATGNIVTDRGRLLEQIGPLVARPGSMLGTRGNAKQVEALAKLMKQGGYDLGEWMLPPELKNPQIPQPEPPKPKPAAPAEDDAAS